MERIDVSTQTVGVVGAGTIGRGVAQSFAEHGFGVVLVDVSADQLAAARRDIAQDLRLRSLFVSGHVVKDIPAVLDRVTFTGDVTALDAVDFVVENVTEHLATKQQVYQTIDRICRPDVPFAVNTSAISVTRLAGATSRRDRMLGLHFMNPVALMPMVEVVRGYHTSDETIERAVTLLARLGKSGVIVNDSPGFITNRVLMLTINEAIFAVQDQVTGAVEVDRIFKGCFGHKMGPLETADLIGLDTILNSITVLYESYRDSKYRPAPLLQQMVDAGLLGRKTGKGFYTYELSNG
jgi:3-hydroxybutyryl-CoA dehydrogenase